MRDLFKLLLTVFPLLISCERIIDFPSDGKGRIYIDAILSEGGENRIKVNVSTPLNGECSNAADDIQITLQANDKFLSLERDTDYESSKGEVSYIVKDIIEANQTYVLKAEAEGLEPIKATTTIPAPLPEIYFSHSLVDTLINAQNKTYQEFNIQIKEASSNDSYFGIQMLRKELYPTTGEVPKLIWERYADKHGRVIVDKIHANSNLPGNYGFVLIEKDMLYDYNGGAMKIIEHNTGSNKLATSILVSPTENMLYEWGSDFVNGVPQVMYEIYQEFKYKLKIYRLSPQMYHCIHAKYIEDNSDAPLHLGLSPATYVYTNIEGGLGMFGAVSCYESDWFDLVHRLQ